MDGGRQEALKAMAFGSGRNRYILVLMLPLGTYEILSTWFNTSWINTDLTLDC